MAPCPPPPGDGGHVEGKKAEENVRRRRNFCKFLLWKGIFALCFTKTYLVIS